MPDDHLDIAIKASIESAKILKKYFKKGVKPERKPDGSPVTIADKESEMKITAMIKKAFPDYNILGEEFSYEKTESEYKWIIDPLDMTSNFTRGVPFYSILIALERKGKIILGVINLPEMDILAHASLGKGAFVNGKKAHVSKVKTLEEAFVLYGDIKKKATGDYASGIYELINLCRWNRGYGDALGHVLLAKGNVDLVLDRGKPWDLAPSKIIIEEAGGRVSDYDGKDTIYSGNSLLTNKILHKDALEILGLK